MTRELGVSGLAEILRGSSERSPSPMTALKQKRASEDGWGRGRSPGSDPTRIGPGHTPSHATLAQRITVG